MKGPNYTGDDDDPGECEGCGSDEYGYRPSMGHYLCEGCHNKGVRAYMKAAGVSGSGGN